MPDRTINFGESETEATYQIQDTDGAAGGGNFVVAKDTNANTVLLEYDPASDTWQYAGDVDMNGGNVSGVGTLTADSVNTEKASVTNETVVDATLGANKQSLAANTWHQIVDTKNEDRRDELDSNFNFNPDESGRYDVEASVEAFNVTAGEGILIGVRDVDTDTTITETIIIAPGAQAGESVTFLNLALNSGTNYQIQARNNDAEWALGSANDRTRFTIRRAIVS